MRKQKKIDNTTHHDIFYPSSKDKILEMISECEKEYKALEKTNSKVFIVPHASYQFILPLLVNTFTSIKDDFDKILILAPSHLKLINENSSINLFTTSFDAINTPLGTLDFEKESIEQIFHSEMINDTYFEEESSFEQLYILIQHYFLNKKVIPICAVIENSIQSKNFSTLLNKIIDEKTLIFISSNASSYQNNTISYKKAKTLIEELQNSPKLLQLQKKNIIDCCACGIIDSIAKTKLYKDRPYNINLVEIEGKVDSMISLFETRNKCVYHISATIKEI